ncbi:MAG: hypothetical protein ABJK25_00025 [Halieaceae bacterium]
MNWDAVGAIAEVIGAVAVIITLAYLAVQIRQNSRLLESNLVESHVNAANEVSKILASESGAANIFWDGLENTRTSLTLENRRRFDALLFLFVTSGYQAFRQNDEAALTRADWILQFPGFRDWWSEYAGTYPNDFREYIATRTNLA